MDRKNLENAFTAFGKQRILIVGDVMVDSYLWGKVDRISPEAPVPVVSLLRREYRPGGAANVALNIQSMGATPVLCSVIGEDHHAAHFLNMMKENELGTSGIIQCRNRITTTKFRIIGNNTHMLRVDEETDQPLEPEDRERLLEIIAGEIGKGIDAVIFEDYDKGVLGPELIAETVRLARGKNIPIAVDPKKRNFNHYQHLNLFKPNLKELREGLKIDSLKPGQDELDSILEPFARERDLGMIMVTLSEAGVYIGQRCEGKAYQSTLISAHLRKIADVSGAGDSVIAVSAMGLAAGLTATDIAALANLAGGLVCEEVGVVPVKRERLLEEALLKLIVHD